jgi:hypothetical protein
VTSIRSNARCHSNRPYRGMAAGSQVDGPRATRLRKTLQAALDKCFETVEISAFHEELPRASAKHSELVEKLGVKLLESLRTNIEVRALLCGVQRGFTLLGLAAGGV